jgi:cytochrome bd-type quinol oxidase subunit 1
MNQIDYTLNVRNLSGGSMIVSTITSIYMLLALDPLDSPTFMYAFMLSFGIFMASVICIVAVWYYFSYNKKILNIAQTNNIIYQSVISSTTIILIIMLQITSYLNIYTLLIVAFCYSMYQIYSNSNISQK